MRGALRIGWTAAALTGWLGGCTAPEPGVGFNADVRPILNEQCLRCHGGVRQQGGVSFLFAGDALRSGESGRVPVVPGDPDASELLRRVTDTDPEARMPLEHPPLSAHEIQTLRRWIEQGAAWETHWAWVAPDPDLAPPSGVSDWPVNGIDRFVLARLEAEGLTPSPEAERAVLLRRASLDLIGLPPTPEEVDAFLRDTTENAFEQQVDRLLASPHFGERWAAMWLDLARYGDSQGYQKDRLRPHIWRYRDWVIDAFNRDLPFDRFTIEQLAGDLLPGATENQVLATAFHRNTMTNDEGGTDDEEFRNVAVMDRVNTTFEVWQGVTIACVQCHGHPYDPFRHEDYYGLFAFFNNTADADRTSEQPRRMLLSPAQQREREAALAALAGETLDPAERAALQARLDTLAGLAPGPVPVMEELPPDSSRTTHLFERGNWLVHGEVVEPDVPGILPALADSLPRTRLGLAQWLVGPENPLTGRVMVNRFWAQLFGTGLVETVEDFGTQGARPSHPALLDWLAVRFRREHGWSVKALLKEIVMSATYRQASVVSPILQERDPANRLLARGPRIRLKAEQIRDQALTVSGLLAPTVYGPSVMPPQPEGVWNVIRHVARWDTSEGPDRHRRALYTFWRRSSPYPSMMLFDSPSREFCVSRRVPTNTPLQALVTLNDPVYFEAARALAGRMRAEAGPDPADRLRHGYRLALARPPDAERLGLLTAFYERTLAHYRDAPDDLAALLPGDSTRTPEHAALVNTANVLMNLDAFITKE